jgi:hypothetical protein
MKRMHVSSLLYLLLMVALMAGIGFDRALAHCDGMDGPVVTAAKKALETGDVHLVLIWVQKKDEAEINKAFQETLAVRKLNSEAKELADMYFFETLVRIHRAGEGAPYTGLKPAGRDLGPAIPAADKAIRDGKIEPVIKLLTDKMKDGIKEYFEQVMAKQNFKKEDIEAGREYIEAYVTFIHYIERLFERANQAGAHGHYPESEQGELHKH